MQVWTQQRLIELDGLIVRRSQDLRKTLRAWDALQPLMFTDEESLEMDREPYDLSARRLKEASPNPTQPSSPPLPQPSLVAAPLFPSRPPLPPHPPMTLPILP